MKYTLNCRQPDSLLQQADEILVEYRDRDILSDLFEKYPDKIIILEHSILNEDLNWTEMKKMNILSRGQLVLKLSRVEDCRTAQENDIKFFLGFPVTTWSEANALIDLGVCYLTIDGPIFFSVYELSHLPVELRVVPNRCFLDGIPRESSYYGTWIIPEAMSLYEGVFDVVDFDYNHKIKREAALFNIYKNDERWPGQLNLLIADYPDGDTLCRLINPDDCEKRLNCGQRCQVPEGQCRLCERVLKMAHPDFIKEVKKLVN